MQNRHRAKAVRLALLPVLLGISFLTRLPGGGSQSLAAAPSNNLVNSTEAVSAACDFKPTTIFSFPASVIGTRLPNIFTGGLSLGSNAVERLAWSADGKQIAGTGQSGTVTNIWTGAAGVSVATLRRGNTDASEPSLALSGGKVLLPAPFAGKNSPLISVWDPSKVNSITDVSGPFRDMPWSSNRAAQFAVSERAGILVARFGLNGPRTLAIYDLATLSFRREFPETSRFPIVYSNDIALSDDGTRVASAHADGSVTIYDLPSGQPAINITTSHPDVFRTSTSVAFSPQGEFIAASFVSNESGSLIQIFNSRSGDLVAELTSKIRPVGDIQWLNENSVAYLTGEKNLIVWIGPKIGQAPTTLKIASQVNSFSVSRDRKLIAVSENDFVMIAPTQPCLK